MPSRSGLRLPSDGLVFLAVPDGAVVETAERIAKMRPAEGIAFVHVSGAHGLGALEPLRAHEIGSFHPLQSFPAPRDPSAFRGITVAVDASTPALMRRLRALARAIGARPRHVTDRERVLYHAAAVFASNFLDVVVWEGVRILMELGWTEAEGTAALVPLVEGAVANIRRRGTVGALTGPIRRGDAETVRLHLEALTRVRHSPSPSVPRRGAAPMNGEEPSQIYRMLALVALEIARQAGLDPAAAERTRKTLVTRALTPDVAATRRRKR